MNSPEYFGRHAKLDEHGEPVETESNENYQPEHAKLEDPWQEMADSAPEFLSDGERQKQIVEKWRQRLEAVKPGIAINEKSYDELVDELLFNRDALEDNEVSDQAKPMLTERKAAAEGILTILEAGAFGYKEDQPNASTEELTDGSVILKKDREAYDSYRETLDATQSAYNEFDKNCSLHHEDLEYDEWTTITEGEVRGSRDLAPRAYSNGIWDEWMGLEANDLTRPSAERAHGKLQTFLFEDHDRHIHLERRAKLITLYNELNEYLYGERKEA